MKGFNWKYFLGSVVIALALCAAQIGGSSFPVMLCCGAYIVLTVLGCLHDYTLPIVLFFLPWAPILRTGPDSYSFYTIGLVLLSVVNAVKNWYHFKRYHIAAGILLLLLTLLSKLIDGNFLAMDYLCFMMMIVVFPMFKEESKERKYDFFSVVAFFAVGIVTAALCAEQYAGYGNIKQFISVASYKTIVRRCGFYGDSNFYTAQITAAIGGILVLLLREKAKSRVVIGGLLLLLLSYCGFMSGSKSFVLIAGGLLLLWMIELLKMRGRLGLKMVLIVFATLAAVYIATSSLFGGLIKIVATRFAASDDLDGFTTGRLGLWQSYIEVLIDDLKVLFLGKGFVNALINGRASHNTILQMIFQLGLLGAPVLVIWIYGFWKDLRVAPNTIRKNKLKILILIGGAFLPWMALDILFFDEFFLLQWFCFVGIQALQGTEAPVRLAAEAGRAMRNHSDSVKRAWRR